ncbi:hypothetical protein C8R45DRAFT_877152 [Mycena sanguinolenta]|nr:hypothetical protein C8R45DRAFT_877152 [Mycena sanguinolenta]
MPLVCEKCGHSRSWDADNANRIPAQNDSATASHRAALAEIQAEITRFKTYSANYISALEKKQEEVKAKLEAIVYPVLSLPPEITSRIFVECLPDRGASALVGSAPLLLMRVCRRWKDIALSTPQLWSSLCIESCSGDKIMVRRGTFRGLETWFSRAGECPLSLDMRFNRQKVSDLEQLDLSSFYPRLCRLHASLPDADIKDIMKNAPLLAELHWWPQSSGNVIDLHGFTSNTITTLRIDSFDPLSAVEFITIIQNFPALCDLTCNVKVKPDERRHTPPLTFPGLSSLCLFGRWEYAALPIYVLELLTLPHLGTLRCESFLEPDVVIPFLTRSNCVIRMLGCDFRSGSENIAPILGILPSLETLKICVHGIKTCLAALEPDDGAKSSPRPILVPKLQYITVTCKKEIEPPGCRRLIDVVNLRRARSDTAKLKSVHIFGPDGARASVLRCLQCPCEEIIAGFRSLIEGGLDFKIYGKLEWSVT